MKLIEAAKSCALWALSSFAILTVSFCAVTQGLAAEDFYKDKTINFYIGLESGTGYDVLARLLTRHMPNHIPGKPLILPRNMVGAGSRTAAGYAYNVAAKDPTVLVMIDQSVPLEQVMGEKLQFDTSKFNWIGNPEAGLNVVVAWAGSGVRSINDARQREVILGSTGSGSSRQPALMNAFLGTKFKIVTGYKGGAELNLALERREIDARTNSWATLRSQSREWLNDKKINILAQIGLKSAQDITNVPLLIELASNEQDRAILRLVSAQGAIGRPIAAPPGVSTDQVALLRAAFDATMIDPDFVAEAAKLGYDLNPMSGIELQNLINEVVATPPQLVDQLVKVLQAIDSK